jgi:hypothetical protein
MAIPLGTMDRAVLTARAGILRAGTGRANAVFEVAEMETTPVPGRYIWHDQESDIATGTVWTTVTSDITP